MAEGAGGSSNSKCSSNKDPNGYGRVYRAVAAGESAEEVRRVIELCAQGSAERRAAAANAEGFFDKADGLYENGPEMPLQAAHRLRRGDLVGALLEAGADAEKLFGSPHTSALELCIAYSQVDSLRALLRSGKHDANELAMSDFHREIAGSGSDLSEDDKCSLLHVCISPPTVTPPFEHDDPPPQLEVLVREFGADVNTRATCLGRTPLHWIMYSSPEDGTAALELLLRLGADVNVKDDEGETPIFPCAGADNLPALRLLLARGASVDVISKCGDTPLAEACCSWRQDAPGRREVVLELLRRSSPQTRRSANPRHGSAADALIQHSRRHGPMAPWRAQALVELLASGAPLKPRNVPVALSIASSHSAKLDAELRARRSDARRWRAHEAMVWVALDAQEARGAQEAAQAAARRVEALEQELGELEQEVETGSGEDGEEGEGVVEGSEGESGSEGGK